jgi:hypothetical protein
MKEALAFWAPIFFFILLVAAIGFFAMWRERRFKD